MSSMVNFPRLRRSAFIATSLAAALSVAQASANESVVGAGEPVTADVAVPAVAAPIAEPALTTTAAARPTDASPPIASTPAAGAGVSASRAMASTTYPPAKRVRVASTRPYRHVASGSYDGRSSDGWYGRHFVLMVGIAY
jgi:hypothetical protein